MKRSQDIDIEGIFESLQAERPAFDGEDHDHPEWDDVDDDSED